MSKYILLFLAGAAVLQAGSVTSVSCTLGNVTINASTDCSIPFFVNGIQGFVAASVMVRETPGDLFVDAAAGASTNVNAPAAWSASATGTVTQWYITPGPKRPGFIAGIIGGFGGNEYASVGGVVGDGTFPFELGVPFEAIVIAGTSAGPNSPQNESSAGASFMLLEADNQTPVPFYIVPEPMSGALLGAGLGVGAALIRKRRRA
ncbi:MAG TPA: PEP-CTERM sorting domain-containing protein [Bryobacteraceae bacterium]|jgi:hypothetical protein|nr:PEP-CTERM sorting domain-containing protein [Bryobacteraceae bacterium]